MTRVEVDADSVQWPARCCRCGAADFKIRPHSEKVILWTTLGVTKYRQITISVPVCDRCANAHYYWFVAAALIAGIGFLPISLWSRVPSALLAVFAVAILVAFIGSRKRALKIVKLDEKTNRLSLDIFNERVATALKRPPNGSRKA